MFKFGLKVSGISGADVAAVERSLFSNTVHVLISLLRATVRYCKPCIWYATQDA